MPIRFRRSMKLGPGFRFNLAKKSAGLSFGTRGMRYSLNSGGRSWRSMGIPGTGLSHVSVGSVGGGKGRGKGGGRSGSRRATDEETPPQITEDEVGKIIPGAGFFSSGAERSYRDGVVAFVCGELEKAEEAFAKAAEEDRNSSADLFHALCLVQLSRTGEAIAPLERLLESEVELPDKWLEKYGEPLTLSLRMSIAPGVAVEAPFDETGAALMLAQLYQSAGRVEEGIDLLEGLGEAGVEEHVMGLALADLHVEREEWDEVLDLSEDIQNEDDATAALLACRGRALLEKGITSGALDVLRTALKSRARSQEILAEARYLRGRAYEELGQLKRALNDYERTLGQDHNHEGAKAGFERLNEG